MKKQITLIVFIFYSILSFGQISSLTPYERVQYFEGSHDWEYKETYWKKYYVYRNSKGAWRETYLYAYKFYLDVDNDGYGDPNNYVVLFMNSHPINDDVGITLDQSGSTTVYDAQGTSYDYGSDNYSYVYDNKIWVRNTSARLKLDCDDNDPNLPSGMQMYYRDYDDDDFGSNNWKRVVILGCGEDVSHLSVNNDDCNDYQSYITNQPGSWYFDLDGDGYGNPNVSIVSCEKPNGYVSNSDDCDDQNSSYNNESIVWYADFDDDGFGDANDTITSPCQPYSGYIANCYLDDCPTEQGTRDNGCPLINYDFDNNNKNYIYERLYLNEFQPEDIGNVTNENVIEQITYLDGIGRVKQQNSIGVSASGKDIIQHHEYDGNGFNNKVFLPYASTNSNGLYDQNSELNTLNYYNTAQFENTTNPYSEAITESSPRSRILEQGAPGNDWQANLNSDTDNTIKYDYQYNENDEVKKFSVYHINDKIEQTELKYDGYYNANELSKTILKDENWTPTQQFLKDKTTENFIDKQGRVVIERKFIEDESHDTYYVYDLLGNLTYVVAPKAADNIVIEEAVNVSGVINQENFSWIDLVEVDENFASDYNKKLIEYKDKDVRAADIENKYNGQGGFALTAYSDGTFSVDINFSSTTPLKLKSGIIASFSKEYKIKDVDIGQISGNGYTYKFYIKNNDFVIDGSGELLDIDQEFFSQTPNNTVAYIDNEVLDGLCYIYHYDYRNRLIEKKVPGKGWEYIVYNKQDIPVLAQDAKLKLQNKWLFSKIDNFGRVAYTGFYEYSPSGTEDNSGRLELQNIFNNQTNSIYYESKLSTTQSNLGIPYSNDAFPNDITKIELLTVNYYDNYNGFDSENLTIDENTPVYDETVSYHTNLLPTASKVKVLETNNWTTSVIHYDEDAKPIYVASKNQYLNTTDTQINDYDFTGKIVNTQATHTKDSFNPIVTVNDFTYDHVGRLLTQSQTINTNDAELILNNAYNELGQLKNKKIGGDVAVNANQSNGLQTVDYSYTVRGWLKQINDVDNLGNDLFATKLNYNTTDITGSNPLYNGNIAETHWVTANDNIKRSYQYTFDALNRIKTANYFNDALPSSGLTADEDYGLSNIVYDKNGNILSLNRIGKYYQTQGYTGTEQYDVIDDLSYSYELNSNTLNSVNDAASIVFGFKNGNTSDDDYQYDVNGNMVVDRNKGISLIDYNFMNLPNYIAVSSTNGNESGIINYVYDATGRKLSKDITYATGNGSHTIYYAGNYIYERKNNNTALKFISHTQGYIQPEGEKWNYVYQIKDHLGNVRLSFTDTNQNNAGAINLEIIEENNYYPFGLKQKGYNNAVSANTNDIASKFKYNGIELEEAFGLNLYEMDFRQYDSAIARFTSIDPVTHFSMSTYTAFDNNPVYWSDPSGADAGDYDSDPPDRDGKYDLEDVLGDDGELYRWNEGTSGWELVTFEDLDTIYLSGPGGNKLSYDESDWLESAGTDDPDILQNRDSFLRGRNFKRSINRAKEVLGEPVVQNFGLFTSSAGAYGAAKLRSGKYKTIKGTTGNFNDRSFKKLSANAKVSKSFASSLNKVGKIGTGLAVVAIIVDVVDDGNIKASTVVNATLLTVAIAIPVTAPFIAIYSLADFIFDFSGKIDENFNGIETGLYGNGN